MAILSTFKSILLLKNHQIHLRMVHFSTRTQNLELVKLKHVTYTQSIFPSLGERRFNISIIISATYKICYVAVIFLKSSRTTVSPFLSVNLHASCRPTRKGFVKYISLYHTRCARRTAIPTVPIPNAIPYT